VRAGSRIRLTAEGPTTLHTGRGSEFGQDTPPAVARAGVWTELRGYETVYDLVVCGDRVAAIHEGFSPKLNTLEVGRPGALVAREVDQAVGRVGLTTARTFIGFRRKLRCLEDDVSFDGVEDFACVEDRALVSCGERLVELDARGRVVDEHAPGIGEVSAVAADSVSGGWLLGGARGVFQLHRGALEQLAPALDEGPKKVRRSPSAVYARVGRRLLRVGPGEPEHLETLDNNGWYWEDFDANVHGAAMYLRRGVVALEEAGTLSA
jgi:hypothetical protein